MKFALLFMFVISFTGAFSQSTTINGVVTDEQGNPIAGVNIVLKDKIAGTITDASGRFELSTNQSLPITIVVSIVGFQKQEIEVTSSSEPLDIKLAESRELMDEVVVSASRVEESILESPVSIEKMDLRDIQQTASVSFYDALENLKGVEMVT